MKNLNYVTGSFALVLSLILAGYLAFTPIFIDRVYGTRRTITICLLVTYSIFRGYRLISGYLKERRDENNLDN